MISFAGFTFTDYLWTILPFLMLIGCFVLVCRSYHSDSLAFGVGLAGMSASVITLVFAWAIIAPRANLQVQLEAEGYAVVAVHHYMGDGTTTVTLGGSCPREADVVYGEDDTVWLFDQNDTHRLHPLLPHLC